MNGPSCPTCGWGLRWLPEQGAWGCDRCRKLVPAAPAGRRSSKGLVIGLGVGAVAVAGTIIAVVVATGGGGGGHGSREDLVKGALAAMGTGDAEQLVKLSDPVGLFALAIDCSERDKRKPDEGKPKADGDPDRDKAGDEGDAGEADDPQIQEKRVRRKHEKLVEKTRGMKLELVSIAGDRAKEGSGSGSEGKAMKKGDRAMKGCVFKVDVAFHELIARVRVTGPDGKEPSEQDVALEAIDAGGSWYLAAAPKLGGAAAGAGAGAIAAKAEVEKAEGAGAETKAAETKAAETKAAETAEAEDKAMPTDTPPAHPADPLPPEGGAASGGADLASLPGCAAYRRQIDKIRACPKFPPSSADALRKSWDELERNWAGIRSNAGAREPMNQACETIVESLQKSLAMMCP